MQVLDTEQARQLRHDVQLGPLAARVNHFKYSDFLRVYEAATPQEKKQLDPIRLRKREDLLKKGNNVGVYVGDKFLRSTPVTW